MKKEKIFYGWWIVIGSVIVLSTVVPLVMTLANKFLIPITQEMGISRSKFSLINTITQALGIFLSPIVAKLMSKGNMRKLQSISVLGFSISYATFSLAHNVIQLYIIAFIVGIFYFSATIIPISMMITNWFVKKRGLAISLAMTGIGLGGFVFSPVVTYLITSYGWRTTYLVMAIIVILLPLPISIFVLREKPEDMGLKAYGSDESNAKNNNHNLENSGVNMSVKASMVKPFFFLMIFGMFLNGFINTGALGQFPPAIEEMHGPEVQAAIISLYSLIGMFGKVILGWINDRFGIIVSTLFGCLTFALIFIFMLMGSNIMMLYLMAVSFGLGMGIGSVIPPLIVGKIYGRKNYGEAYGIANSAVQVGLATGSLSVAMMYDNLKSYNLAWILLFILTLLTFVFWAGSIKYSKKFQKAKVE